MQELGKLYSKLVFLGILQKEGNVILHPFLAVAQENASYVILEQSLNSTNIVYCFVQYIITVYLFSTKYNNSVSVLYNTPGTAGGPGSRDRTLAVKSRKNDQKSVVLHISSSYAKILGEILQGLRVAQAAVTERWP